jgi:hypothetical protein
MSVTLVPARKLHLRLESLNPGRGGTGFARPQPSPPGGDAAGGAGGQYVYTPRPVLRPSQPAATISLSSGAGRYLLSLYSAM